jgi:hypothetical protein
LNSEAHTRVTADGFNSAKYNQQFDL